MASAPLPHRLADERRVLSVSAATRMVREVLEVSLSPMWVAGEVSNLRSPTSGHVYLTLKDRAAQLRAVVWRDLAQRLPFRLEEGLEVLCFGRITVYEPRGEYQMTIEALEPKGRGALQVALEQLVRRLEAEGLFDPRRKRPLPRFPATIGIVTSPSGAAIKDILEVIERRFPKIRVILRPVRVQGDGAAAEVAAAIREFAELAARGGRRADVLIVGRGGGAREDLWAFNDEAVARAIACSPIPVISSVGHAIDTTVADLVADRRALTPTEAAELATPLLSEVLDRLETARERLRKGLLQPLERRRERLDAIARSYAFREPLERIRRLSQRLDELGAALSRLARRRVEALRERAGFAAGKLDGLSPLRVLARGYSVTVIEGTGAPVRDAAALRPGDRLRTRFASGEAASVVESVETGDAAGRRHPAEEVFHGG